MLQDVNAAVVTVICQHVAQSERVDDASVQTFVERQHRTASQAHCGATQYRVGRRGVDGARCRRKLDCDGRINRGRSVVNSAEHATYRLAETVAKLLSDIFYNGIDGGGHNHAAEVCIVGVFADGGRGAADSE